MPAKKPAKEVDPLDDFRKKMNRENRANKKALDGLKANKHFNAETVMAELFAGLECGSLHIGWALDKFWGLKVAETMPKLQKIYDEAVKRNYTRENNLSFNDMDDKLFVMPHDQYCVLCHELQSSNYVYVWERNAPSKFQKLHVRRYFDVLKVEDKFDKQEEAEFKKKVREKGKRAGIIAAQRFVENYADDYPENPYPKRLSLDSYIKAGFEMKYGDCRDEGYILTWDQFRDSVDRSYYEHSRIEAVLDCYIPSIEYALFEEGREEE
jgi:hypothetical protein